MCEYTHSMQQTPPQHAHLRSPDLDKPHLIGQTSGFDALAPAKRAYFPTAVAATSSRITSPFALPSFNFLFPSGRHASQFALKFFSSLFVQWGRKIRVRTGRRLCLNSQKLAPFSWGSILECCFLVAYVAILHNAIQTAPNELLRGIFAI